MELANQTALITGGTAGIGLACAEALAREGVAPLRPKRLPSRCFLASPRSSFITGSTLHADGGGTAI